MIITIDGPAGSGKSTAARNLAKALGIAHLDTGATYRAVTLKALREKIDLSDESALVDVAQRADIQIIPRESGVTVILDGKDVTGEIRSADVSENASKIAACGPLRTIMVDLQRKIGQELGSFVTEGRDQGSVVFPHADVKFYIDASPEVRAQRRAEELAAAGEEVDPQEVLKAIVKRDGRDSTRAVAPLVKPRDAIAIDTSKMTIAETTAKLVRIVEERR